MANAEMIENPSVIVVGGGVAGLTAAHRLLQRGYDVTLIEANDFLGGKLAAHRRRDVETTKEKCSACENQGGCLRRGDWHEHCYHMYLNWYHNFWELMEEVGVLDSLVAQPAIYNIHRRDIGESVSPAIPFANMGSPWTTLTNMFAGTGGPADMMLLGQTQADLAGEPEHRDTWLEKTSITAFMKSRAYTTDQALATTMRTTAQAFASPSYLSSARSYKGLLSYGMRLPEPSMWLLTANAQRAIFMPWLMRLARVANCVEVLNEYGDFLKEEPFEALRTHSAPKGNRNGKLTIRMLTSLKSLRIDEDTGLIVKIELEQNRTSPTVQNSGAPVNAAKPVEWMDVKGDLILAVPLDVLGRLATPEIASWAPNLPDVRYLRTEPMISMDLFFKRRLPGLPNGITVLLDSPYEMNFFDNSQTWKDLAHGHTVLNVVASNADTLVTYSGEHIKKTLKKELRRYIEFSYDDVFECRTYLQTNIGEQLFVNQVGSWQWRPQTTCGISNLFIAGDYCQTFIDVVTIEGATVSGLMAAEALRRRRGKGRPIRILQPDQYPVLAVAALAASTRPVAYLARAVSSADFAIKSRYSQWFPNG